MSGIAGQLATSSANTAYVLAASEIFSRQNSDAWGAFTYKVPCDGQSLEVDVAGPSAEVRELIGSQRFSSFREYARRIPVKPYRTDALELPRQRVELDKSGTVEQFLRDYLSANAMFWYKPVVDVLLSNPTCLDGVSLLNDSHPYASGGGTWDNKTTSSLDATTLEAGWVAMSGLKLENGAPAGIRPTHLMVSPKFEREAMDLLGVNRAIPFSNAGVPDAAANVVAAVVMENWLKGRLQLIVEPRMYDGTHDDDWLLMDLSKPSAKPVIAGEAIAPQAVVVTSAESESMIQRDSFQYYVTGNAAIGGFVPHVVYGKLS